MQPAAETASDRKLSLTEVLNDLVKDGIVGRAEADKLIADRRMQRADHHPMAVIADQKWKSLLPPNKLLHIELLTEWLAAKVGLGYFHIDPLKINFSAVTDIMSNAYAQRFKILPVEVNSKEAVIAAFETSRQKCLETAGAFSAEQMDDKITTDDGETTRAERCRFMTLHLWYHSGQLNFIQTLLGDTSWHWS